MLHERFGIYITCFVIRRTHHPYVLNHTRRTGWERLPAHGSRLVFNDRRREETGRQDGETEAWHKLDAGFTNATRDDWNMTT
jgi:hypothetical protein